MAPCVLRTAFMTLTPVLTQTNYQLYIPGLRPKFCSWRGCAPLATAAQAIESKPRPRSNTLVLVGLGNPGPRFNGTRHNIGFDVVDIFVKRHGGKFSSQKNVQADVAVAEVGTRTVHVVKPRTFMNLSGDSVRTVMRKTNAPEAALLVVVDDMSLEVGRLRFRAKGSAGGHNGLKSIEARLGSREYARLKVGVGSPRLGAEEWKTHVLGKFSGTEAKLLEEVKLDCMEVLDLWITEPDINRVINLTGTLSAKKK